MLIQQWIILKMLWTFGCSHTQGHGLPDCIGENNQPLNKTSKFSWPNHLAELLNEQLTNIAHAGVGTKCVWNNFVNAPIKPGSIAVIMWPCWESRIDILADPQQPVNHAANIIPIRNWQPEDEQYFNNYYSAYDQWVQWHLYMTHAYLHSQIKRIQLIQCVYNPYESDFATPEFSDFKLSATFFGDHKYCELPRALDNSHHGEQAHIEFAQDLFREHYLG